MKSSKKTPGQKNFLEPGRKIDLVNKWLKGTKAAVLEKEYDISNPTIYKTIAQLGAKKNGKVRYYDKNSVNLSKVMHKSRRNGLPQNGKLMFMGAPPSNSKSTSDDAFDRIRDNVKALRELKEEIKKDLEIAVQI